jgi:glyoxylase-like metal-dependent hydrolase (beta-lactamase superfamily II)
MYTLTEIAEDVYRICVFYPQANLGFTHFLVKDDEPLLFHAGFRAMFPLVREAVAKVIDPATLRYVGFSHFESDECGALNQWLDLAPQAEPVCGLLGAMVTVNDFANRPARALSREETISTGKRRYRFIPTPHLPHGWDAGLLFEETGKTLFCSDLFVQGGVCDPVTTSDIIDRCRTDLIAAEGGPFAGATPYTARTGEILRDLASYRPETLAIMHGSSYSGDGGKALMDLSGVLREVLGSADV